MERKDNIRRVAKEMVLIERAKDWFLGDDAPIPCGEMGVGDFFTIDPRNFFRLPSEMQKNAGFRFLKHKPTWGLERPDGTAAPEGF